MDKVYWNFEPYVDNYEFDIEFGGNTFLHNVLHGYVVWSSLPFLSSLFWCLGVFVTVLLAAFAVTLIRKDYTGLMLIVPVLIYSGGTALILSGPSFRYFYFIIPTIIPAVFLTLFRKPYGTNNPAADN